MAVVLAWEVRNKFRLSRGAGLPRNLFPTTLSEWVLNGTGRNMASCARTSATVSVTSWNWRSRASWTLAGRQRSAIHQKGGASTVVCFPPFSFGRSETAWGPFRGPVSASKPDFRSFRESSFIHRKCPRSDGSQAVLASSHYCLIPLGHSTIRILEDMNGTQVRQSVGRRVKSDPPY
jgi:hypothetical protein